MFHINIYLEKDVAKEARKIIDKLDLIDRGYFGKDRKKQIKSMMDETLALLDTKPIDLIQNKKEKAEMLYLKGKCLDFNPEYTKQAEENLSKSIKLMPTKVESWDALGHVYWKKNDIHQSKKCFEGSQVSSKTRKTHRLSETSLWFTDSFRPPQMVTSSTQRRGRRITKLVFKWLPKLWDKILVTPRVGMLLEMLI